MDDWECIIRYTYDELKEEVGKNHIEYDFLTLEDIFKCDVISKLIKGDIVYLNLDNYTYEIDIVNRRNIELDRLMN
jgi:hypothetical protein